MQAFYSERGSTIIHGKAEEVLPTFAAGRFATVITDPPYELGFMNKGWDSTGVAFRPELWGEVMRVCKPGAFLLAFGGTRTFHRLACAIEDAGWEIRDDIANLLSTDWRIESFYNSLSNEQRGAFEELVAPAGPLAWLYGSGFPKSLNIGKAIDKGAGAEQVKVPATGGLHKNRILNDDGWAKIGSESPLMDSPECVTDLARQWNGWGTALKPAWEPIIVAMKPLAGTFAENAAAHGVAGLNIDGGRVSGDGLHPVTQGLSTKIYGGGEGLRKERGQYTPAAGRWPPNVILDEEAAALLDRQSGQSESRGLKPYTRSTAPPVYGLGMAKPGKRVEHVGFHDVGGASRFFYTSKASKSDRGHGNDHPTVKPVSLIKYLCKLTDTPTHSEIIDPFGGSMTTLVAAREVGRPAVAIDMEEGHCRIGAKRLSQGVLFGAAAG